MFPSDMIVSAHDGETIRHEQGETENHQSRKGQLTIFYGGTMNVYDSVPIDKAQAIMLLAGQSSMYDPLKRAPTTPSGGHAGRRLPSVSELEAG
ncbi:protein TIFY 6a-like [Aristolochia californica]|uniref:protein TIFY 6a-like n=1 Tax=Aristolochia californica TaxID=171875 RepID=UPI0035DD3DDD